MNKYHIADVQGMGQFIFNKIERVKMANSTTQHFLDFVVIWNNIDEYPTVADVAEKLDCTLEGAKSRARRYRDTRKKEPQLKLPKIANRHNVKDGLIEFHEDELINLGNHLTPDDLAGHKKFIVTSAQFGAKVNKAFLKSLQAYAKEENAQLVILPIRYGRTLDPIKEELRPFVLYENAALNSNIQLNQIKIRPTIAKPLTSLKKTGGRRGQIFAHPKIAMRMIARDDLNIPKPIMTTGAVTYPNYKLDKTGMIAERDHCFGAVLVDVVDEKRYHFRHIQAVNEKSFQDSITMKKYTPKGVEKAKVESIKLGDWHTWWTCPIVRKATFGKGGIIEHMKPKSIFLEDLFDATSISHHDEGNGIVKVQKSEAGLNNLQKELDDNVKELRYILRRSNGAKIYITASNHNEHLDKYLQSGRYKPDSQPHNTLIGNELFNMVAKSNKGAFELYMRKFVKSKRVTFLSRDDSVIIEGCKMDMHGDLGANGSRGSLEQFDTLFNSTLTGHAHQPAIEGTAYQTGTSTILDMPYVRGPSSWAHTHGVVFKGGQKQLVNIIKGCWGL